MSTPALSFVADIPLRCYNVLSTIRAQLSSTIRNAKQPSGKPGKSPSTASASYRCESLEILLYRLVSLAAESRPMYKGLANQKNSAKGPDVLLGTKLSLGHGEHDMVTWSSFLGIAESHRPP